MMWKLAVWISIDAGFDQKISIRKVRLSNLERPVHAETMRFLRHADALAMVALLVFMFLVPTARRLESEMAVDIAVGTYQSLLWAMGLFALAVWGKEYTHQRKEQRKEAYIMRELK